MQSYHAFLRDFNIVFTTKLGDVLQDAGYTKSPKGTYGAGNTKEDIKLDMSKAHKFFPEFKWRSLEESIKDMAVQYKALGVL